MQLRYAAVWLSLQDAKLNKEDEVSSALCRVLGARTNVLFGQHDVITLKVNCLIAVVVHGLGAVCL